MSYEIKRTDAEINEQLNKAADGINDGSQYPGMSYVVICFKIRIFALRLTSANAPIEQITPETNAGVLPFIYMRQQTFGNARCDLL